MALVVVARATFPPDSADRTEGPGDVPRPSAGPPDRRPQSQPRRLRARGPALPPIRPPASRGRLRGCFWPFVPWGRTTAAVSTPCFFSMSNPFSPRPGFLAGGGGWKGGGLLRSALAVLQKPAPPQWQKMAVPPDGPPQNLPPKILSDGLGRRRPPGPPGSPPQWLTHPPPPASRPVPQKCGGAGVSFFPSRLPAPPKRPEPDRWQT